MIIRADSFAIPLRDGCVHCVVTSPPYWGLRQYSGLGDEHYGLEKSMDCLGWARGESCQRCYVCHTVAVFREVKRVLHPSGVCFLNIGDSYAGGAGRWGGYDDIYGKQATNKGSHTQGKSQSNVPLGLKPKDQCCVPERVKLALQANGWYVRSDIIWQKPSCMPESVTDRPTRSYEHVFLLTKSERYYWDAEAVREVALEGTDLGLLRGRQIAKDGVSWHAPSIGKRQALNVDSRTAGTGYRNLRDVWTIPSEANTWATCCGCGYTVERWPKCAWCGGATTGARAISMTEQALEATGDHHVGVDTSTLAAQVNRRNPKTFLPPGYDECPRCHGRQTCPRCNGTDVVSHYAAFPQKLPEICIKAGSSEKGVCAKCEAPWERMTEVASRTRTRLRNGLGQDCEDGTKGRAGEISKVTLGWRASCLCDAHTLPALILDPFAGSGTTLLVAERLGRGAVGLEMSVSYIRIAQARLAQRGLFS